MVLGIGPGHAPQTCRPRPPQDSGHSTQHSALTTPAVALKQAQMQLDPPEVQNAVTVGLPT